MRPGGSKEKGSEFERKICKLLSLWVSCGGKEDLFTRNVLSGGQFTGSEKRGKLKGQAGDLMCSHPDGRFLTERFIIECKHYRDLDLFSVLQMRGEMFGYLKKLEEQANRNNRHWLFITQQNGKRWPLVFMPHDAFFTTYTVSAPVIQFSYLTQVYVMSLEKFLAVPFKLFISSVALRCSACGCQIAKEGKCLSCGTEVKGVSA